MFWLIITFIIAIVEWVAAWRGNTMLNRITKPAVLIALILWFSKVSAWQPGLTWFGLALILSLAGDIFLLRKSNRSFYAGLAAFMTAHLFYIFGFNQTPLRTSWGVWVLLAMITFLGFSIGGIILRGLRKKSYTRKMIIPVMVYIAVICVMFLSTLLTLFRPAWPLQASLIAILGGLLFTTSDALLGYDRFVKPIPHGRFIVMLTYHLAQIGLITGALMQAGFLS